MKPGSTGASRNHRFGSTRLGGVSPYPLHGGASRMGSSSTASRCRGCPRTSSGRDLAAAAVELGWLGAPAWATTNMHALALLLLKSHWTIRWQTLSKSRPIRALPDIRILVIFASRVQIAFISEPRVLIVPWLNRACVEFLSAEVHDLVTVLGHCSQHPLFMVREDRCRIEILAPPTIELSAERIRAMSHVSLHLPSV